MPTAQLSGYEFDWTAPTGYNVLGTADTNTEYKAVSPLYKENCAEMWNVANPLLPLVTAKRCVKVNASYTGSLIKSGSSSVPPTDIDIKYDKIKVGAGWNLY